jgi:hypothetical protein
MAPMKRRLNARAVLTMVTVLAHLAGVSHMAFVAHTLSSTGAVIEVSHHAPLATAHRHQGASLCARSAVPDASWMKDATCEAVTSARASARPAHPAVTHVDAGRALVSRELRTHDAAWAPPPLVVAPKNSPPSLG